MERPIYNQLCLPTLNIISDQKGIINQHSHVDIKGQFKIKDHLKKYQNNDPKH